MRCQKVRRFLSGSVDGGPLNIPPEIADHLQTCDFCASLRASFFHITESVRRLATEEIASDFTDRLLAKINAEPVVSLDLSNNLAKSWYQKLTTVTARIVRLRWRLALTLSSLLFVLVTLALLVWQRKPDVSPILATQPVPTSLSQPLTISPVQLPEGESRTRVFPNKPTHSSRISGLAKAQQRTEDLPKAGETQSEWLIASSQAFDPDWLQLLSDNRWQRTYLMPTISLTRPGEIDSEPIYILPTVSGNEKVRIVY